ncbi:MAG TPA: glycosyltransferase family 2 protein [Candidatus Nanoarchaeia archaeon]|nr:glycosyltransferase family 2 protein [Candidatus Nanoarchaeia archaeon]
MVHEVELSIVIPAYNEADSIPQVYQELKGVLDSLQKESEIIFIDDGSSDSTFSVLEGLHNKDPSVKVIRFRRNFGQTAALQAGFSASKGKLIVTMDADLQNDPKDIPRLLERQKQGYDAVSGWRSKRKDNFSKRFFSKIAEYIRRLVIKDYVHDSGCSLKVYTKESIKGLALFGEMHRFIPAILVLNGFKVGELKVNHQPRLHGKTKYGIARLLKGLLDLVYIKFWSSFSTRPLHFFGLLGFFQIVAGVMLAFANLSYHSIRYGALALGIGPVLLFAGILIILGVQFIVLGFLGEILIRTYYKDAKDKGYVIEKVLG